MGKSTLFRPRDSLESTANLVQVPRQRRGVGKRVGDDDDRQWLTPKHVANEAVSADTVEAIATVVPRIGDADVDFRRFEIRRAHGGHVAATTCPRKRLASLT